MASWGTGGWLCSYVLGGVVYCTIQGTVPPWVYWGMLGTVLQLGMGVYHVVPIPSGTCTCILVGTVPYCIQGAVL